MTINDIRSTINDVILEFAIKSNHYKTRIKDRLLDKEYSDFYQENDTIKNIIIDNIKFVQKLTFPSNVHVGVHVGEGSKHYYYINPVSSEHSDGKHVWVAIRNNILTTVFFRSSEKKPTEVDYAFDVETLKEYIRDSKDGIMKLNHRDIGMLSWVQYGSGKEKTELANAV